MTTTRPVPFRMSTIVAATDFQQSARRAFVYAVRLASVFRARLKIVHVIKTATDSADEPPASRSMDARKTSALLQLGRLAAVAKEAKVEAEPLLLYGSAVAGLEETVRRTHAGLIVMGTEGRTGWDRLRLGSTAEALVREAPCPVLTLHGTLARDVPRHHGKVRMRRWLVGMDGSPDAEAALRVVCRLAPKLGASVRLVQAIAEEAGSPRAEHQLERHLRDLQRIGIDAEGRCVKGAPVEVLLEEAAHWDADAMAVGTQGRSRLRRLLLGSVAAELLKRAGCPVLTVRRHAAGQAHRTTS